MAVPPKGYKSPSVEDRRGELGDVAGVQELSGLGPEVGGPSAVAPGEDPGLDAFLQQTMSEAALRNGLPEDEFTWGPDGANATREEAVEKFNFILNQESQPGGEAQGMSPDELADYQAMGPDASEFIGQPVEQGIMEETLTGQPAMPPPEQPWDDSMQPAAEAAHAKDSQVANKAFTDHQYKLLAQQIADSDRTPRKPRTPRSAR